MEEVVYRSEVGTTGVICQFIKTGDGYTRQQIFPNGTMIEGDYTEEEYQKFLHDVEVFQSLQKRAEEEKKARKKPIKK